MPGSRTTILGAVLVVGAVLLAPGCGFTSSQQQQPPPPPPPPSGTVVNSLDDSAAPPSGTTTLRSAIAAAGSGDTITFNRGLNGQTILISIDQLGNVRPSGALSDIGAIER